LGRIKTPITNRSEIMLIEGIITLIIVAALFYVAPGVLYAVYTSQPLIVTVVNEATAPGHVLGSAAMNASLTTSVGALNLSAIGLIMLGIGIMIGGFMLIRGYK
jgi:hypothetical protein